MGGHLSVETLLCIVGECGGVDFVRALYSEALEILQHHLRGQHSVPGVILEQAYLNKMQDGIKPLARIAARKMPGKKAEGPKTAARQNSVLYDDVKVFILFFSQFGIIILSMP